jgi:hypothetical protein
MLDAIYSLTPSFVHNVQTLHAKSAMMLHQDVVVAIFINFGFSKWKRGISHHTGKRVKNQFHQQQISSTTKMSSGGSVLRLQELLSPRLNLFQPIMKGKGDDNQPFLLPQCVVDGVES